MYHLISNFNSVLLLGWGILHPVCALHKREFIIILTNIKAFWFEVELTQMNVVALDLLFLVWRLFSS